MLCATGIPRQQVCPPHAQTHGHYGLVSDTRSSPLQEWDLELHDSDEHDHVACIVLPWTHGSPGHAERILSTPGVSCEDFGSPLGKCSAWSRQAVPVCPSRLFVETEARAVTGSEGTSGVESVLKSVWKFLTRWTQHSAVGNRIKKMTRSRLNENLEPVCWWFKVKCKRVVAVVAVVIINFAAYSALGVRSAGAALPTLHFRSEFYTEVDAAVISVAKLWVVKRGCSHETCSCSCTILYIYLLPSLCPHLPRRHS